MRKLLNLYPLLFVLFGALLITSCGEDDPIIDPGVDGINVGDGLYLQLGNNDPLSSAGLSSEIVATEGLGGNVQERSGFQAGYMWLEAGNYSVVQVTNKEITATIGGSSAVTSDEDSSCDFNDYTLVTTSEGGAAFTVGSPGLYKVTHDAMTNELILYNISEASVIGSATEGSWSNDTPLTGSVTSEGGSWSAEGVVLRNGEWKVRLNCRWSLDRRIDKDISLEDASNGYQFFTNFGGSPSDLAPGGANIPHVDDGTYTLALNWDPQSGWSFTSERTGDAPVITFDPDEFRMAVIGDATAGGWESDQNLFHKQDGDVHTWYGVVTFGDAGEYKFRTNDSWDFNIGGDLSDLVKDGANIPTPGPGGWYIVVTTPDEGTTWSAMVSDLDWSIIGEGGPSMDWGVDTPMESSGFVDGRSTYTVTGEFGAGEWKFRAGRDWPFNLGGDIDGLTVDGGNLTTGAAGTYTVDLIFDGEIYKAVIQ